MPYPGDLTTIDFDNLNLIYTIETSNIARARAYSIQTRAIPPSGADLAIANGFKVTIVDPCISATLSFDPTMTPSPYDYLLQAPADIQSIPVAKVLSAETLATCPSIELSIVNDDLTPIDSSIFIYDAVAETLTSESSDEAKVDAYPMKIQAKYSGTLYPSFEYDFTVNVINPCRNGATITPNSQTNPAAYAYTGSTPPAIFTLTPFTIDPSFCTQTFTCFTLIGTTGIC